MRRALVTVGYLGRCPVLPGTAGTLAAVPLVFLLARHTAWPALWCSVLSLAAAAFLAASAGWTMSYYGQGDPQEIVLDEVAGYLAAGWSLAWQPPEHLLPWLAAAFLLFRLLDMLKPFPIDLFERIPRWGIVADDLLAGVLAGALLCALPLDRLA